MNKLIAICMMAGVLALSGNLVAEEKDPRLGNVNYQGSGDAERAPEYAEVWMNFSVGCQESDEAARKAIEAVSNRIWRAMSKKVPADSADELSRTYWGDITVSSQADSHLHVTPPRWVEKKPTEIKPDLHVHPARPVRPVQPGKVLLPGKTERVHVCTKEKLEVTAPVGQVFSAQQSFGVRSTDLDWIEGLARTVAKIEQDDENNTVKISLHGKGDVISGDVGYSVSEDVRREMLKEIAAEARDEALGPKSKFESDKKSLKFASAHFLGRSLGGRAHYHAHVGQPLARGKNPKVSLELPITYNIYAEGADLIDSSDSKVEGLNSSYEVKGHAVTEADFGQSNMSVSVKCQATKEAAANALEAAADKLLERLEGYQGKQLSRETDRITDHEASEPSRHSAYKPVAYGDWDQEKQDFPVAKYLDTCSNQLVDAPAEGEKLPYYWQASQAMELRSSRFEDLLDLIEELQHENGSSQTDPSAAKVSVANPVGNVTLETKKALTLAAREDATQCVLDPNGQLADDAKAHGFKCAHLKSITVGSRHIRRRAFRADMAAPQAAALESASEDSLEVEVELKDGEQRPKFKMERHYNFSYQFRTENYLKHLNPQAVN